MAYEFRCDAHTHTLYSRHAYSTIMENLQAARNAGLELLGSADHFSSMLFPTAHIRNFQYFLNMDVWPRIYDGVVLLRGAEADIVDLDGGLYGQDIVVSSSIVGRAYQEEKTLFERVSDNLDYLVASVHNGDFARGASIEDATRMYLNVLAEPKVFILGHVGRSGVPFDVDAVLTAARDAHKLIEINEHSLQRGPQSRTFKTCREIARRCAELGVGITASTDAHIACDIGEMPTVAELLASVVFPEELVMNRSAAAFLDEMAAAGVCDLTALAL